MEDEDELETKKKRSELESTIVNKVGEVINSVTGAKHVDRVILSLYSLARLLFPLDPRAFSGSIDERYRDEVLGAENTSVEERDNWWEVFYGGASFPTLSRLLLYDVALNWLPCFPISARKHVYDVFFTGGRASEVLQTLVVALQQNANGKLDHVPVCSNAERLVALCLLENNGVLRLAREFSGSCSPHGLQGVQLKTDISRITQLVTSIPDKARIGASKSLSSHLFFKQITVQLLALAEELDTNSCNGTDTSQQKDVDGTITFVGEIIARICRRGSSDVLLSKLVPGVLHYVRGFLSSKTDLTNDEIELIPVSGFWSKIIVAIKDPYTVERVSEQLLRHLASHDISDTEGYWVLWLLFHQSYKSQTSIRCMFVEKFLFWKTFPVCCLRWILHFAILKCPPDAASLAKGYSKRGLLETVQHLVSVWSKREFVQSASVEQQAYVTAAIGLSLEQMSKEDLDATKDALQFILQGVSCRLENPSHLVRKMASCVALVFSKIIDPKNPLYLDDLCPEENINWEFGTVTSEKSTLDTSHGTRKETDEVGGFSALVPDKSMDEAGNNSENAKKTKFEVVLVDPDEVIDPAMLNNELISDEEGYDDVDAVEDSETSSNSSLQPYDLSDDDTDLKGNLTQLVDVIGALRKSDDADGVDRALNVSERLIRASPDELKYVAGDLCRTLVQARCFDSSVDGEEDSAEEKRQKALVALIVKSPLESLDTLNKLLYSPNLDVSQRIMILDVMTGGAEELSHARTTKPKHISRAQISTISETQPWFVPSSLGPPGAGSWKEITRTETPLNWSYSYERELPTIPGQIQKGKSRRWSSRMEKIDDQLEWSENRFPQYAAAFMLPSMQGFDKKRHGVDLLGRDFIVLGKLVYMLGVCMKCAAMHPEASALALPLMDMLSSRVLCHHVEPYVRRAVLFAASCILVALHPSYVASALVEGNSDVSKGLEWIRTWALNVAESDTDRECYTMAMACLQLHAEMALQASRAMESITSTSNRNSIGLPSEKSRESIRIPLSNVKLV